MSRIGRKPIVIPAGVTVTVDEAAHHVAVKGPKGSLNSNYHPLMTVKVEGNEVLVSRPNDEPQARSLHGLTRTNIANMVNGVVNGYEKKLEIARALATKPKLLLLDEPAAGMNPNETEELMDTIRFVRDNFDMTILLIEHDMKLVSGICEELTVLNFGHVLRQGKTSDVLHDPEVIKAYLGE